MSPDIGRIPVIKYLPATCCICSPYKWWFIYIFFIKGLICVLGFQPPLKKTSRVRRNRKRRTRLLRIFYLRPPHRSKETRSPRLPKQQRSPQRAGSLLLRPPAQRCPRNLRLPPAKLQQSQRNQARRRPALPPASLPVPSTSREP